MPFFRDIFAKAAEVESLRQQLAFEKTQVAYQLSQNDKLEWKIDKLEKQVESERKRFDKTQAIVMDYTMHKTQGIGKVEKIQSELPLKSPEELEHKFTPTEESTIEALAKSMQTADAESGLEPYPLPKYIAAIKSDASKYQSILIN